MIATLLRRFKKPMAICSQCQWYLPDNDGLVFLMPECGHPKHQYLEPVDGSSWPSPCEYANPYGKCKHFSPTSETETFGLKHHETL